MGGSTTVEPAASASPQDRLGSWKEIATYLGRDVTTVQRWERREGMPVHRHLHQKSGSVYAFRDELDAWLRGRHPASTSVQADPSGVPPTDPRAEGTPRRRRWMAAGFAAVAAAIALGAGLWLRSTEFLWRSPIDEARFQRLTDFEGVKQGAAISRDGRVVAFLSDRDGRTDVWVTQVGSAEFHNLTLGRVPELVNPSVRMLAFSPDGSQVTFWVRRADGSGAGDVAVWAVPTLGGAPKPFLDETAEVDWSADGERIVYHTAEPGDPTFLADARRPADRQPIFTAPSGLHAHFPSWSPDGRFIYFVEGAVPDQFDVWRVPAGGGQAERITSHRGRVSYPVLLDRRTLVYLAADADGSGPWLYGMDVERRVPHRLGVGIDRYTSLSATPGGGRLVATVASARRSLWRVPLGDAPAGDAAATRLNVSTTTTFAPRFGPGFLVHVAESGGDQSIWRTAGGAATQIWSVPGAVVVGAPAVSPDGTEVAFSVRQRGKTSLHAMRADGTNVRLVTDVLDVHGSPAWSRDGRSITVGALAGGVPRLYRVPLDGTAPVALLREYSTDPAWSPDGRLVVYSGPDVGTSFPVRALASDASPHPLPPLVLTRGGRHVAFMPGGKSLIVLRGEIQHKNLWLVDLEGGGERQLTNFTANFDIRDFDISPDGREIVVERVQEQSDVVLIERSSR
jgi:Tol biopolymer transport system component